MSKPQAKIVRLSFGMFVAVYGETSPPDAEWQAYMTTMRGISVDDSLLIFSWGGGPTLKQRRELEEVVTHHQGNVAVVTESRIARRPSRCDRRPPVRCCSRSCPRAC